VSDSNPAAYLDNAIDFEVSPAMAQAARKIDAAIQRCWHGDPQGGLSADEVRERVADLEVLLPQIALHADEFQDLEDATPEDFRVLYKGFALYALVVMIDARNLLTDATVAAFVSDLEQISADVYELRKHADGLDDDQRRYLTKG
jgi:hypothetical protein